MTQEQNNISKGWKTFTTAAIAIFILAIAYQAYGVFSKETQTGKDYSNLTIMASIFILMLILLRPVFKKW
jgi:uncharacterized membrane protein